MRARNIKPGFFENEYIAELSIAARLLFIGLWCMADREGRLEDRPKKIKMNIFPYDNVDIDGLLNEIARSEDTFIFRYEIEGKKYIQINNFHKHQKVHLREKKSIIPPMDYLGNTKAVPNHNLGNTKALPRNSQDLSNEGQPSNEPGNCKAYLGSAKAEPRYSQGALNDERGMMNDECGMMNDEYSSVTPEKYFQEKIGTLSGSAAEEMSKFIDEGLKPELINKAIDVACDENILKWNYVKGILNNCQNEGIKTLEQFCEKEKKKARNKSPTGNVFDEIGKERGYW